MQNSPVGVPYEVREPERGGAALDTQNGFVDFAVLRPPVQRANTEVNLLAPPALKRLRATSHSP